MKQGLPRGTVPDRQPTSKLRKCASLPHFSIKAAHMPVLGYQRLIEAFFSHSHHDICRRRCIGKLLLAFPHKGIWHAQLMPTLVNQIVNPHHPPAQSFFSSLNPLQASRPGIIYYFHGIKQTVTAIACGMGALPNMRVVSRHLGADDWNQLNASGQHGDSERTHGYHWASGVTY